MSKDQLFVERRQQGDYAVRRPNSQRASAVRTKHQQATESSGRQPEDYNTPIRSKDDIVRLEEEYETATEIPCCITDCHQPHKRGRYALLTGDIISRVCNVCARRLLGDEKFTLMERDFEQRRRRALRERFISSPTFDPEGALAALKSWDERIGDMGSLEQDMIAQDVKVLTDIKNAVRRNDSVVDFWDRNTQQGRAIRLRGARFLAGDWEHHFTEAKVAIQLAIRLLRKHDLSDDDLQKVVRSASEARRRLRVVADVIGDFDQFCKSQNTKELLQSLYRKIQIPATVGTIDRSAINKLGVD
jgi:hypothetical protein